SVDRRSDATTARRDEDEVRAVRVDRHRPWGRREGFRRYARSCPCRPEADEGHVMTEGPQLAIERTRERLGATDRRQKLLRDDDAHAWKARRAPRLPADAHQQRGDARPRHGP